MNINLIIGKIKCKKVPCDVQVGINNCGKLVELFVFCIFFFFFLKQFFICPCFNNSSQCYAYSTGVLNTAENRLQPFMHTCFGLLCENQTPHFSTFFSIFFCCYRALEFYVFRYSILILCCNIH